MKDFVAGLLVVVLCVSSSQAIDRTHYRELQKKFGELAQQKDWKAARELLTEMGHELPALTPRYLLTVATVEARLGHKQEALRWLGRFAATGLSFDLAKDDDLKALLSEEAGQKIAAQMKANSKPVATTELVCALPQVDIMPEDLTHLKSSNIFIVSSIQHHTPYQVSPPKAGTKECTMQELPLPAEAKRWPTLAVSADPKRKALWITSSAMPDFVGFPKEDQGKALLLEIDEASGQILHSFDPGATSPAVLGDMSVAEDGAVYVTDSIGGGVYRLRGDPQTAKLEKIADGLFSPQTPVLARDGKRLFVADYSLGIAVVDLTATGPAAKVTYLPHPENVAVVTLDGLYLNGDSLVGIQNGIEPMRIMRFRLNHAQTEITGGEVIEQSERMGDPTHVIAVDGWFYVSANVGWNKVDDSGKLKPGENFTAPVLLRFPAGPR